MIKVLIYPEDKRLVNDTPFAFHPDGRYRVVVILGFDGKTKIYSAVVSIPYDLRRENKLKLHHCTSTSAKSRIFKDSIMPKGFNVEFHAFITDYLTAVIDNHRRDENHFTMAECEHLGEKSMERHRKKLRSEVEHWDNVASNYSGTSRTRAFGRQMRLMTQGMLNHYDGVLGKPWNPTVHAVNGVIVF